MVLCLYPFGTPTTRIGVLGFGSWVFSSFQLHSDETLRGWRVVVKGLCLYHPPCPPSSWLLCIPFLISVGVSGVNLWIGNVCQFLCLSNKFSKYIFLKVTILYVSGLEKADILIAFPASGFVDSLISWEGIIQMDMLIWGHSGAVCIFNTCAIGLEFKRSPRGPQI